MIHRQNMSILKFGGKIPFESDNFSIRQFTDEQFSIHFCRVSFDQRLYRNFSCFIVLFRFDSFTETTGKQYLLYIFSEFRLNSEIHLK